MSDTQASIKLLFHQRMTNIAPEKRFEMGCSMFDTAKEFVRRSILEKNPDISQQEFRKEIFLRFYGRDFKPEQKNKILSVLYQES